jgi:urate oxidase
MADQVNVTLSANRYGKDKVRVFRVIKPTTPGGKQIVLEYNVRLMIEGDFETRLVGGARDCSRGDWC